MDKNKAAIVQNLGFAWNSFRVKDTHVCHGLVHDGVIDCFKHFLYKVGTTGKIAGKYYIVFHIIWLLLKLRKHKKAQELPKVLTETLVNYCRSVLFMSFHVALQRYGLCFAYLPQKKVIAPFNLSYNVFAISSITAASSIMFEQPVKRIQVSCYLFAKGFHSFFLWIKRIAGWTWNEEGEIMHISLLALLYYIYNHHPELLKLKKVLQFVLGDGDDK